MTLSILLAGVLGITACDSGDSSDSTTTSTLAPAPTTRPPTVQDQVVDLQVTGERNVTLRGTMGSCRTPSGGLPKVFHVTNPALGPDGYIFVFSETIIPGRRAVPPNVKLFMRGLGMLSPVTGAGVRIASNGQSVTLDAELSGPSSASRTSSIVPTVVFKGRITGTIRCS